MKIWLTPMHADEGVIEMELLSEPVGNTLCYDLRGMAHTTTSYVEGVSWHRERHIAVHMARAYRQRRIQHAIQEADRLVSLPPIT